MGLPALPPRASRGAACSAAAKHSAHSTARTARGSTACVFLPDGWLMLPALCCCLSGGRAKPRPSLLGPHSAAQHSAAQRAPRAGELPCTQCKGDPSKQRQPWYSAGEPGKPGRPQQRELPRGNPAQQKNPSHPAFNLLIAPVAAHLWRHGALLLLPAGPSSRRLLAPALGLAGLGPSRGAGSPGLGGLAPAAAPGRCRRLALAPRRAVPRRGPWGVLVPSLLLAQQQQQQRI